MRWRAALTAGIAMVALTGGVASATTLSVTSRLQDRREVASGPRAYAIGFENGRFYANGWHITGEMGGVWTPPLAASDARVRPKRIASQRSRNKSFDESESCRRGTASSVSGSMSG